METLAVESTTEKIPYLVAPGIGQGAKRNPEPLSKAVAREFGIPEEVLIARMNKTLKTRKSEIVNALQTYVYLVYTVQVYHTEIILGSLVRTPIPMGWRGSPVLIAKHSGYSHCSIYHCEEVIQNYIDTEPRFKRIVYKLTYGLQTGDILMPVTVERDTEVKTTQKN